MCFDGRFGGRLQQRALHLLLLLYVSAVATATIPPYTRNSNTTTHPTEPLLPVPPDNHVTLYWLECCIKANTRIPFQLRPNDPKANRSTLLYRPFGFALPLKGFDLCRCIHGLLCVLC